MDARGNLTLPAEVRQALGVDGALLVDVEVRDGAWVIRPGEEIPDDDVWLYTPENVARTKQARARPREEDFRLTPEQLENLTMEGLQRMIAERRQ